SPTRTYSRLTTPEIREPTRTSAPTRGLMMPVAFTTLPISRRPTRAICPRPAVRFDWRHRPRAQTSVAIASRVRTPAATNALLTGCAGAECREGTFLDCFSSVLFRHVPATIQKRAPLTLHRSGPVIASAGPDCRTAETCGQDGRSNG